MARVREVHRRFAAWFEWLDISKTELGKRLGCTQPAVFQMISGQTSEPRLAILRRIEELSKDWPEGPILVSEWDASGAESETKQNGDAA